MKAFRIVVRSIRDALKSVFRNFSLSMASIMCATITLTVVFVAIIVAVNVNNATTLLKDELNIVVYLEKDVTEEQINEITNKLKENKKVKNVEAKSKNDWKNEIIAKNSTYKAIFEYYDSNPLLDTLVVQLHDVNDLENMTDDINAMPHVSEANYFKETVNHLVKTFDIIEKIALVIMIALVFVTAFLITNTIKLTIYSRREEIEIMRLVGASNMAIKLPFVFEGFVIGVLGSIIPNILCIYSYIILYTASNGRVLEIISLVSPYNIVFYIALVVLGLGALIGMLGSLNAVRKYLKI